MKTMKNFIFLFVMVVGARSFQSGKVKRSLVSRFTSNPFFLSHFAGGNAYYDDYAIYRSKPKSGPYRPVSTWENSRKIEQHTEPKKQDEKPIQPAEVFIFNTLPRFDHAIIFKEKGKAVAQDLLIKKLQSEEGSVQFSSVSQVDRKIVEPVLTEKAEIYIFNSLPHYHRSANFGRKTEKLGENGFNFLPFREVTHVFKNPTSEIVKSHQPVDYHFSTLPHFEIQRQFFEPELFVSKLRPEEAHKKIVKVVRKKKIHNKLVDVAERRVVVGNIADLPLENPASAFGGKFNSYGGLVSPQ